MNEYAYRNQKMTIASLLLLSLLFFSLRQDLSLSLVFTTRDWLAGFQNPPDSTLPQYLDYRHTLPGSAFMWVLEI